MVKSLDTYVALKAVRCPWRPIDETGSAKLNLKEVGLDGKLE